MNPIFSQEFSWNFEKEGGEGEVRGVGIEEEGCGWRSGSLSSPHKLAREFFSPFTLQQQTKRKMEKPLCTLAAVILLGGFLDAVLTDDTTTQINLLSNYTTTAESVTVQPQDHSTDRLTPTEAPTKLSTTAARGKQLDTKNISQDSEEENSNKEEKKDVKTQLGRTKLYFLSCEKPVRLQAN